MRPGPKRPTFVASTGSQARPSTSGRASTAEVSDAKRLKALEDENTKLKKLLAETMLDNAMLKDVAAKKWCRPPPGVGPSLPFRSPMRSASGGRVWRLAPIAPRCGIGAVDRRMRQHAYGCAN